MEHPPPWNRSFRLRPARFALALALGLIATIRAGTAQPPKEAPAPTLELVLGPGYQLLEPDLLKVSFELRNTGKKPVIIAQHPGMFLGMSCPTEDGGIVGIVPGGIACQGGPTYASFLELRPGGALFGEKVERLSEECRGNITVYGEFQTRTAEAWDLPMREVNIVSKSIPVRAGGTKGNDPQ
jgi:hypothetical protein